MKLIDVIKTANGRSYIGENPERYISSDWNRLSSEVKGYDPNEEYEECEFSYKEYARKLQKFESGYTKLWLLMSELSNKSGITKKIADFYRNRYYDIDGDFFEIEKNGDISYMPYNKEQIIIPNSNWKYDPKGRQTMSAFKFFKKIIPANMANEHQIQEFVNNLMALTTLSLRVEFVRGGDIGRIYNSVKMEEGWAKKSCMRGQSINKFALYNDNPDTCELGVVYDKDKIVGRFLRWNTKELGWVEDVLYYATGMVKAWYDERCVEEKLWYRVGRTHFARDGKEYTKRLTVDIVKPLKQYEHLPYLDTMSCSNEKTLHNGA